MPGRHVLLGLVGVSNALRRSGSQRAIMPDKCSNYFLNLFILGLQDKVSAACSASPTFLGMLKFEAELFVVAGF